MTKFDTLIHRMADELDHYRQLLMDDCRETHALAAEARAVLAEPKPEEPTDEEIMELMPQQMRDDLAAAARALAGFDPDNIKAASVFRIILNRHSVDHARAVLDRWGRPAPQPVPVSERLPGPDDCDAEGRCWLLTVEDEYPQWRLHSIQGAQPGGAMIWVPVDSSPGVMVDCFYTSHWLPAHALPVPS